MLNIPETVKALYKRDGVNKNFRAHFPNGELPDITNENIVQESVKFQESVCSQDVFKFGLTEASVIEFETVGIANMYGMTIACYNEIDCSSLSAAEIADIEAGTWDGTWDGTNKVFAVPYGVFRVESCPRDHQAMTHRRVTAYGDIDSITDNKFEKAKTELFFPTSSYEPNMEHLFYSNLASLSDIDLEDYGYEKQEGVIYSFSPESHTSLVLNDGTSQTLYFTFSMHILCIDDSQSGYKGTHDPDQIFWIDTQGNNYDAAIEEAASFLEEYGVDFEASGYSSAKDFLMSFVAVYARGEYAPAYMADMFHLTSNYAKTSTVDDHTVQNAAYGYIPIEQSSRPLFLYGGFSKEAYKRGLRVFFASPKSFSISTGPIFLHPERILFSHSYKQCSFAVYSKENTVLPVLKFENTLKLPLRQPAIFSSKKYTGYSFSNAYSYKDMMNSCLELLALFGCSSRIDSRITKRLSNSSPVAVAPNDYSQMWWDEYDVQPIGTIRYAYTDEAGEEQIVEYQFGDGASVYDMTDNAVLKAMSGASPDVIESLLDTYFVPHLAAVNFTPIDLSMKGLPYIEAGDALSVTAQDGTVCNSYALRQEIDGIQSLTAQIDSESGLILDSEEGD